MTGVQTCALPICFPVTIPGVKKVAQKGLKSKFERDLELQNDIEYYQDVLSGKIKTTLS